ncbi:MAG: hypothetical protein ACKOEO_00370 [Planctomycetaceae bacterium]
MNLPCLHLLVVALLGCLALPSAAADDAVNIGQRRELFVDDALLERQSGVALVMHRPEARDVAIVCDRPWEGNISAYYTLFADGDMFRMYYRGAHWDEQAKKSTHPEFACYAESRDGITWVKPELGLHEFAGSKANNIILTGAGTHNFTPFRDPRPDCPPASRYKALAGDGKGLLAWQSPDGIRWSLISDKPVITNGAFDSQNLAFWDAATNRYRAYWRYFQTGSGVRAIRTASSVDFLTWQDEADLSYDKAPPEHLYTNAVMPYFRAPQLYLGFPTRFQPKNQQVEPVLMTSRDGIRFHRWPEPLIPIDAPQDRHGNRSNYMTSGLLQLPSEPGLLSVYATEAYYAGPGSRVRRFVFRTDGFVSLQAKSQPGEVLTKLIRFSGQSLQLNFRTATAGSLRVELQSEDGQPLPGLSLAECEVLRGDEIAKVVTWKSGKTPASAAGQLVRLKFQLQDADVYSMKFD